MSETVHKSRPFHLKNKETILIAVLSFVLVILFQGLSTPKPFDDAYITYRYARNLSSGLGFVYNPGERVLGTTTPLYTLMLAAIAWIFNPELIPKASQWISIAADAINALLVFRLADWFFKDKRMAGLTSLVFLLHPFRLNVSAGGMETSLFLTALLVMYDRYYLGDRKYSSAVFAAIAVLIRPDAILAVFPLFVDWYIQDRHEALIGIVWSVILTLPWLIWATWYFGSPIPHSITAKIITYKEPVGQAAFYLFTFLGTGTIGPYHSPIPILAGLAFTAPALAAGLMAMKRHRPHFIAMTVYPLLYAGVMIAVNPAMYFSWYYLPLLPGLLITLFSVIWFLPISRIKIRLMMSAILAAVLLLIPAVLHQAHPGWPLSRARETAFWSACRVVKENTSKEAVILAPDIGVIGWCLEEASILDPIGLVSPQALRFSKDLPPDQLISPQMIKDEKPDYIISLDQFIHSGIRQDEFFNQSYQIIYDKEVTIIDQTQPLYIFKYLPDP